MRETPSSLKYAFRCLNGRIQGSQIYIYRLCDAIELHTSKKAREKNQHTIKKRFCFSTRVCISFCFYKRLVILNVSTPHFQTSTKMWKEERTEKQTEQKEFHEKWKYNILSRVRTHFQPLILRFDLKMSQTEVETESQNEKKGGKHKMQTEKKESFRHIRTENECKYSSAHTHNVYNK